MKTKHTKVDIAVSHGLNGIEVQRNRFLIKCKSGCVAELECPHKTMLPRTKSGNYEAIDCNVVCVATIIAALLSGSVLLSQAGVVREIAKGRADLH